jgi:hypothetical protein
MSDELEKLRRLRERQLNDRDPAVKQKQFQSTSRQKEARARNKRYTLGEAWRTIPHVYRSPLIGVLTGLCITILLPYIWNSKWALGVGVGATVLLIITGVVIGQALDVRDNLRDFSKH